MSTDTNVSKIKELNSKIYKKVRLHRLRSAFATLKKYMNSDRYGRLVGKVMVLEDTYKSLLRYFVAGVEDPGREQYIQSISSDLLDLSDTWEREALKPISNSPYFKTLRNLDIVSEDEKNLQTLLNRIKSATNLNSQDAIKKREDELNLLFDILFSSHILNDDEYRTLSSNLLNDETDTEVQLQIASALTLSLIHYYDAKKINLLLNAYDKTNDANLKARALTGVLFAIMANPERIEFDREVKSKIEYLSQESDLTDDLRVIIEAYIRANDTERVNKKMQDEILPEIKKMQSKLSDKFKNIADINDPDIFGSGFNPQWDDLLAESGLDKKLRSMSDMQEDGADVMMLAFANLKNYPFFRRTGNWLLPYSSENSAVSGKGNRVLSEIIAGLPDMCDSDKYSFLLTASNMPEMQLSTMAGQLSAQLDSLREAREASLPQSAKEYFAQTATSYMRNLYRFFKLHPLHRELPSEIFSGRTNFFELPSVGTLLATNEFLTLLAEFYLKRDYYPEAVSMFTMLIERSDSASSEMFEKLGYSFEKCGRKEEAVEAYKKAELLEADNKWLMTSLGRVLKSLERYEEAAEYFKKGMDENTESISQLINMGNLLLFAGKPSEALPWFYKANYLDPKAIKGLRAISWCEFLIGNFEKSEQHLEQLISSNFTATDNLNMAHIKLASGKMQDAVTFYKEAINKFENGLADFNAAFREDLPVLRSTGISDESLNLIMDQVLYDLGI